MSETITAYKGFDADWKCRDFQYEVGKTYTHGGRIEICSAGFHACEYPLDVFAYYTPNTSRFAIVEQTGDLARHDDDTKIASSGIKISAEIDLAGIIKAAIEYTFSRANPVEPNSAASATGERGAASATGERGAASATGESGAASATGWSGAASATGLHSVAMACGQDGRALASLSGAIVLVNRADNGAIRHIRASKVGENGIRPDCFYVLDDTGNFQEAT